MMIVNGKLMDFQEHFKDNKLEGIDYSVWELHYSLFTGSLSQPFTVVKGPPELVLVKVITTSGRMDLKIQRDDGLLVYVRDSVPTISFTLQISEEGSYRIMVDGVNHCGGFVIMWQ